MKTLCLDAGVETARGDSDAERLFRRQLAADVLDKDLVLSDDQTLALVSSSSSPKGMLCSEELDQTIARYTAVL